MFKQGPDEGLFQMSIVEIMRVDCISVLLFCSPDVVYFQPCMFCLLTHLSWHPIKGILTNIVDLNQTQQNMTSDQDLHCLHELQEFL